MFSLADICCGFDSSMDQFIDVHEVNFIFDKLNDQCKLFLAQKCKKIFLFVNSVQKTEKKTLDTSSFVLLTSIMTCKPFQLVTNIILKKNLYWKSLQFLFFEYFRQVPFIGKYIIIFEDVLFTFVKVLGILMIISLLFCKIMLGCPNLFQFKEHDLRRPKVEIIILLQSYFSFLSLALH